jgi:hypothetical protein
MPEENKTKKRTLFPFCCFRFRKFNAIANKFFEIAVDSHWSIWIITIWLFLLFYIYKNFHNRSFYEQNWEREQIDRLVALQQKKIDQLQTQVNNDNQQ